MDAKTIVAAFWSPLLSAALSSYRLKTERNKKQNGERSVKNSVHLLYGGAL